MFKPANQFDTDIRIALLLSSICVYDAETGLYMRRSAGRRRAGRPARYYIGSMKVSHFESEKNVFPQPASMFWATRFGDTYSELPHIQAHSDEEAAEKANRWIAEAAANLSAEGARLLRDVLPQPSFERVIGTRTEKMLDAVVIRAYSVGDQDSWKSWPGSHSRVDAWWVLANGYAVGCNNSPSKGQSFPVFSLVN